MFLTQDEEITKIHRLKLFKIIIRTNLKETNFTFFEKKIILFLNINDSRRIAINESFIKITLLIVKTL